MEYSNVSPATGLEETLSLLRNPGLLLVTQGADGKPNAMTIGWGTVGVIWGKPIFIVLVRPSRYTHKLLGESDSFTVCVPSQTMRKTVGYCGKYSGRDVDKFAECGLTVLPSEKVSAPGIAGCPMIYECKIVHTNEVTPATLAKEIQSSAYPAGNFHRIYYGEVLAVRALDNASA